MFAGAPHDPENYEQVESNGLKVYYRKDAVLADEEEGLKISLWGRGPWRRLVVNGLVG